jgi:AmiR/NasT family two-component response regulator
MSEIDWSKAPEWDGKGARPESGQICEMETDTSDWQTVLIKYISHDGVVAEIMNGMEAFISCARKPKFRPIRTLAELERNKNRERIYDEVASVTNQLSERAILEIADGILSKYNLTEK